MTLLQAKEKAMNLLSETSESSGWGEYLPKLNSFFDTAQKEIAGIKPIIKVAKVTSTNCLIDKATALDISLAIPVAINARKILALMTPDYEVLSMVWVGNNLLVAEDGDYIVEYEAHPTEIISTTPDTYSFEIAKETQEALPFYAAAMCVMEDNPGLSGDLMSMYNGKLTNIENALKIRFVGGSNV